MSATINTLNPQQKEAAQYTEGPLLILAGAGSGKTKTITHRIAYMISEMGVPMQSVLAVTFTNKAAAEMRERIEHMIGKIPKNFVPDIDEAPLICTFHSFAMRLLRKEAHHLGFQENFQIYDPADQKQVMKELLKARNLDGNKLYDPRAILGQISRAKNQLMEASEFFELYEKNQHNNTVQELFTAYQKKLFQNNGMDFDDLLLYTVKLLSQNKDILEKYQSRFEYITVDEYQDTNKAQYELMKLLAAKYENICAVGDDDQSIYGWRWADIHNILDFERDYKYANVIKLEQNYRSTQVILDAAHAVISKNLQRKQKKLWTQNESADKIQILGCRDEKEEGKTIAENIVNLRDETGISYNDIAVLYRTNAQTRALEEAFLREGIPYKIVGGTAFYQRKEIKDILAYLRLIVNPRDDVSLQRIINVPSRKIGPSVMKKLSEYAADNQTNLFDAAQAYSQSINAVGQFVSLIESLRRSYESRVAADTLDQVVLLSGYKRMLLEDDKKGDGEDRYQNIMELLSVAQKYNEVPKELSLRTFLEEIMLVTDIEKDEDKNKESVKLMTLHASKGLEFPYVFLAGVEDGLFPSESRMNDDPSALEEERRLMYVGITRAKNQLFMSYASRRLLYGQIRAAGESMFVREVPSEYTLVSEPDIMQSYATGGGYFGKTHGYPDMLGGSQSQSNYATQSSDYSVGDMVQHKTFGTGKVMDVTGDILTVAFDNGSKRKLVGSVAPLSKK